MENSQLIIKAVFSIISFITNFLEPSKFNKKEKELYIKILRLITSLYSHDPLILNEISEIYKKQCNQKNIIKTTCIYCFNNYLIIDSENHCLFCGLKPTNKEIVKASLNKTHTKLCKNCNSNLIINDEENDICLKCREKQ